MIGIALGGLAVVIGNFLFNGHLAETFVYGPAKKAYTWLENKFAPEKKVGKEIVDQGEAFSRESAQHATTVIVTARVRVAWLVEVHVILPTREAHWRLRFMVMRRMS